MGLVDALKKRTQVESHIIDIQGLGLFSAIKKVRTNNLPRPDVILAAGHRTHIPLILGARKHKALSFVCMSPSLPMALFDLCFIPYHDLISSTEDLCQKYDDLIEGTFPLGKRVLPTMGAMNRIHPHKEASKDFALILVGGPSKYFSWNTEKLIKQLRVIEKRGEGPFVLSTSRRTPKDVLDKLRREFPDFDIYPVEETDEEWIPEHFEHAKMVWVTEDSVSMIFESVSSGTRVGLIEVPKKPVGTPKVASGIRLLQKENYLFTYAQWKAGKAKTCKKPPLQEADRVAEGILERYPQFCK